MNVQHENFFIIDNSVLDLLPKIKPTGLAVYAYLCRCADEAGIASPKQKDIEAATGLSDRTVRTLLALLETLGLIRRAKSEADHRRAAYSVTGTQSRDTGNYRKSETGISEYPAEITGNWEQYPSEITGNLAQAEPAHLVSDIKTAPPIIPPKPERTDEDQPIQSADDLTFDDLDTIARAYAGGAPGPAWCKLFRKQPQVLIALGFEVRRSDLMAAAVAGRAKHEEERGGAPRFLDYFDKALDSLVREKANATQTATSTEPDPATLLANQPPKDALRPSILAEAQATFAAARARKAARAEREANRFGSVLQ